jgi:hypothetical protein
LSCRRKKTCNVHKQVQNKNEKSKGQKRKRKVSDSTFTKSKVVMTHEMWKNKGACKQFHKNKNNMKNIKVERKNFWRLCTFIDTHM